MEYSKLMQNIEQFLLICFGADIVTVLLNWCLLSHFLGCCRGARASLQNTFTKCLPRGHQYPFAQNCKVKAYPRIGWRGISQDSCCRHRELGIHRQQLHTLAHV